MDLLIILATIVLSFAILILLLRRWLRPSPDPTLSDWLRNSTLQINQRLDATSQLMASVQKNLGEMSEVGRGIRSLQDFLQSPKLRGGMGEEILSQMIGQTFPKNSFHLQYTFRSGSKVDAVIKTEAGLLCIDSKFPMSNFQAHLDGNSSLFISDLKKHITDISKKYILPDEKTLDFALMYIPSESVFNEAVNLPEINRFAREHRVYPVSPNTLYAHLQILLLSFQGQELASQTKQIFQAFRTIHKDYDQLQDQFSILQRHVTNAFNQSSQVAKTSDRLGSHLAQTLLLEKEGD